MRIIRQGKIPTDERKKTCKKCNTLFAYFPKDIFRDQRDGDYVKCPLCKAFINIK